MPPTSEQWSDYIQPFAEAIGQSTDEVTTALGSIVGEPGPDAIGLLSQEEYTPFDDIRVAFGSNVAPAVLRRAVQEKLRRKESLESPFSKATVAGGPLDMLPHVPDDAAWLEMLETGGVLKVDQKAIISAVRSALASRSGLFDLPQKLVARMEDHAESLEAPVPDQFYELRTYLTRRSYSEVFAALPVEGSFVTQSRKNTLLAKLDSILWPSLESFHEQLKHWMNTWQQGMANPAAVWGAVAALTAGDHSNLPAGMMQPPDTGVLQDAVKTVISDINRVFAGVGIPVSLALGYDAQCIKQVLENDALPEQVGASNREHMLKMLNVAVAADYVRLERNLTKYTLSILELPKVNQTDEEIGYLTALFMLGSQIPWEKL